MNILIHSLVLAVGGLMLGTGIGVLKEGTREEIGIGLIVIGFAVCCLAIFVV